MINIVDIFKNQDNEQICEAAFSVDENITFNISLNAAKKKVFQKLEILKQQKEKQLLVREQFELDHEDASINSSGFYEERKSDDEIYNLDFIIRKSKYKPLYANRKQVSTFGTV